MSLPAHPRSRGEHVPTVRSSSSHAGSSPLARGTHLAVRECNPSCRLIPARAGNTRIPRRRKSRRAAHPRSRGEHGCSRSNLWRDSGSSPLARGTLSTGTSRVEIIRLIPARAGNTTRRYHHLPPSSAHPRSRGEHLRSCARSVLKRGSSPLARGTRWLLACCIARRRLIPARAGNT